MSNYDQEQREMDEVTDDLRLASILQTIGWVLLGFNGIVVTWVWTGFRAGSYFWLYWTIIESGLGFSLVMAGSYLKTRAGRRISRLGAEVFAMPAEVDGGRRAA